MWVFDLCTLSASYKLCLFISPSGCPLFKCITYFISGNSVALALILEFQCSFCEADLQLRREVTLTDWCFVFTVRISHMRHTFFEKKFFSCTLECQWRSHMIKWTWSPQTIQREFPVIWMYNPSCDNTGSVYLLYLCDQLNISPKAL